MQINKTEIIDKLCKYNEYILIFQTTVASYQR